MDELISEKKLYRLKGILYIKVYRKAKRMDCCFTPYWKAPINKVLKKSKVFEQAKLLDHDKDDEN